jgi:REP element-mobilizing transposase RayT
MAVELFSLDGPPGFRGLHPDIPVTRYHRRLPHWRQEGATYFVTFRLADSLPVKKVAELQQWRADWERANPEPRSEKHWKQFARQYMRRTEAWLDDGYGECVFRDVELAKLMASTLQHFQEARYLLSCYVVMPNHCHATVKPLPGFELEEILMSWKGFVSRKVNRRLARNGSVWQEESYDKIIRNEEHLYHTIQYIGNNPRKAGLSPSASHRWVHPEWKSEGWGLLDE